MARVRSVVIVGGGVAGLSAAFELVQHGVDVTVLEASGTAGGKIAASDVAGIRIDEGADAFLSRVPWAVELCERLDLRDDLVAPTDRSARIWSRGRMHRIPLPTVLGVPLDPDGLISTGLISAAGATRAAEDLHRTEDPLLAPDAADESIGSLIRRRLGDEVHERLVDPLLGGINAGDADHLSLAARAAQIDVAARSGPSLIRALRAMAPAKPSELPIFASHPNGVAHIVDQLVERIGSALLCDQPVTAIEQQGSGWLVHTRTAAFQADAVVLACPAHAAAPLLGPVAPAAAELAAGISFASVSVATFVVPTQRLLAPLDASGFLIPKAEGFVMTATQFLSSKWAHLEQPATTILRSSAGKDGDTRAAEMSDTDFASQMAAELLVTLDVDVTGVPTRVTRWADAFPQYRPGHIQLVAQLEAELVGHRGLRVTGASYGGLGIPDCIRQGVATAAELVA